MKKYKDQVYTGMKVGGTHHWNYNNGKWEEIKVTPDLWTIKFNSIKYRVNTAPLNTGASIGTQFHWYIIADQIATKLDANSYMTNMEGMKFKIGHKHPHWKTFSYNYPEQISYKKRIIEILKKIIEDLERQG